MMKRAAVVLLAVAATAFAIGCASADHSWKSEFTARIEGASAAIDDRGGELRVDSSYEELRHVTPPLTRELTYKYELIRELSPPAGCAAVQQVGQEAVLGYAKLSYELPKNATPELQRKLPAIFKEDIAELGRIEREAETCE